MSQIGGAPATAGKRSAHTFHIPVMGTGFTIDTPLKVARYGISSVISLVDDTLIEQMRRFHCEKAGLPYEPIASRDEDSRARRITAYLNLVNRLVRAQAEALRSSPFEPGSEITRYYELLPDSPLRRAYHDMLGMPDGAEKARMRERLRREAVPGAIDANIMTKLDRDAYRGGQKLAPEFSDAMSALRGFANSDLASSIVFSAGMNQRLYGYAARFKDFLPDENGALKKKITLKVSDFRSALVQGKYLAKRGLWVSEYRVESGLNCGGHAFATKGYLMGPILEEFKQNRGALVAQIHAIYAKALAARGPFNAAEPHETRVTVQGGIGTHGENEMLMRYYEADGTGWATPFLLVPEVVNIDDAHLEKLLAATEDDIYLSGSSPLGVPFWNLRTSASEEARRRRIREGKPGSACPKGHLASNTEFTTAPVCAAARVFQKVKLAQIEDEEHPEHVFAALKDWTLEKSCICHDLAGGATVTNGIDSEATTAVCAGPNIVNFSKAATLDEMAGHIYGRLSLIANPNRPHMFVKELMIYADFLRRMIEEMPAGPINCTPKYIHEFAENLLDGVAYYRRLAERFVEDQRDRFLADLETLEERVKTLALVPAASPV